MGPSFEHVDLTLLVQGPSFFHSSYFSVCWTMKAGNLGVADSLVAEASGSDTAHLAAFAQIDDVDGSVAASSTCAPARPRGTRGSGKNHVSKDEYHKLQQELDRVKAEAKKNEMTFQKQVEDLQTKCRVDKLRRLQVLGQLQETRRLLGAESSDDDDMDFVHGVNADLCNDSSSCDGFSD